MKRTETMKPFARINLSSAALRRGILVSSLALAAGVALMPGEAFAFLGLFESKPTKAEMEKVDSLFKDYYRSNDVESAIAVLPTVKKIGKMKPGGIPPTMGFYFDIIRLVAVRQPCFLLDLDVTKH